jgi:iron-sulfur cluster assembly protein
MLAMQPIAQAPGSTSEAEAAAADQGQDLGTEFARPNKGLEVTPAALQYARQKLGSRGTPGAAIRLGVRGGGCSGYTYAIEFADDPPRERDRVFEFDGVRFYVDKKSLIILAGSTLDFEKTLMFQGFKFRNPQAASSCGCGQSFTVK